MELSLCLLYTSLHFTIGCIISEPKEETIIRSPGESVLLHCSCTNQQIKPDSIRWSFIHKTGFFELIGNLGEEDMKKYSGRVQTFNASSPGNASLLLSNLTVEDHGDYICEIKRSDKSSERTINLIVKGAEDKEGIVAMFVLMIIILLAMLLGTAAVIYWRERKKTIGSSENTEREDSGQAQQQNEDVTYSTVDHRNRAGPLPKEADAVEETEYSSIRLHRV